MPRAHDVRLRIRADDCRGAAAELGAYLERLQADPTGSRFDEDLRALLRVTKLDEAVVSRHPLSHN